MVNSKRYTNIDRYPKYIILVTKPVQPPVRYWLPWWGVGFYSYFVLIFFFLLDSCDVNSLIFRWCVASATNHFPFHVAFLLIVFFLFFSLNKANLPSLIVVVHVARDIVFNHTSHPSTSNHFFFLRGHIFEPINLFKTLIIIIIIIILINFAWQFLSDHFFMLKFSYFNNDKFNIIHSFGFDEFHHAIPSPKNH